MALEISKEQLKEYKDFLTVGKLKEFLSENNLSDDSIVVIQRVEDVYFDQHNWGVYLKEGSNTAYDDQENVIKDSLEQYHPAWCCVRYKDDPDILFIDLHY